MAGARIRCPVIETVLVFRKATFVNRSCDHANGEPVHVESDFARDNVLSKPGCEGEQSGSSFRHLRLETDLVAGDWRAQRFFILDVVVEAGDA
ncbi:hypothetical protein [Paraburkholderia caribensis]|uniref:hypothetical protein n=1 Tax=Paraburkholderia caribensis TaxID=75105 RepID=UPI001CC507F7|nr:hypothetical protein [Paraburkholderia caribensis]